MFRFWLASLLFAFTLESAHADGEYLLNRCEMAAVGLAEANDAQRAGIAYCFGLLQGVRELNALYQRKFPKEVFFCLDKGQLSHSEAARLVVNYLRENPKARLQNETVAAVRALRQHFPCP